MKPWMQRALQLLAASLEPPRHELNELDWKAALSPDKKRLTEHLAAFVVFRLTINKLLFDRQRLNRACFF
jgi:hypothetical protein